MGYNQWCPLSFDGATPYFNSLHSWNLNAASGEWSVAPDNDYVKNGSFEADRKAIPSTVKPVQAQLTGWSTTVVKGTQISLDTSASPFLNHSNSDGDRKSVAGEKSLCLSDKVAFARKVSQVIASSPHVKLNDGYYTLTAKVRNSSGFARLEMYAECKGKILQYSIGKENGWWKAVEIKRIAVKGGRVEIGFWAEGAAGAFCYVDDVSLVKAE